MNDFVHHRVWPTPRIRGACRVGRRRRRRSGYVLVVTLGLLVLSTTLLVAVGRMATQHALAAKLAADDLQRRWGAASCRTAVLPFAESILASAGGKRSTAVPVVRISVNLGNQNFVLIVSDEMAKANINALLEQADAPTVESRIRQNMSGTGLGNRIRLRPTPVDLDLSGAATTQPQTQPSPLRITSFGQIFDGVSPDRLISGPGAAPIERLTCWGAGAINVMRASRAALQLGADPPLSGVEIDRLIDARNAELAPQTVHHLLPPITGPANQSVNLNALDDASRLLAEANIKVKDRSSLAIVTRSTCHSMWIVITDARRTWYELDVRDDSTAQHPRNDAYVW